MTLMLKKLIYILPWYNDNDVIGQLCIKLPQMIGYIKHFDSIKTMSCEASDKKTVKKVC